MFDDYRNEIVLAYDKKKENGNLSINLRSLAPGKLRDECSMVYKERFLDSDNETLRSFFGPKDDVTGYSQIIDNIDIDRFRPLINFLNRRTNKTERKNIELLAWLIDFKYRPHNIWINRPPDTDGREDESGRSTINFYDKIVKWLKAKINSKNKKSIASFALIAIAGGGSYAFLKNTDQCMYWTGHQYQSVGCDVKVDHATVIALDQHKVDRLKRITRLDTIAEKDLGKVWYVKIKQDSAEFYTDSGNYPLNNKKVLMPMTKYILDKYILHK